MTFIYKNMVYSHSVEIQCIVFALVYVVTQFGEFGGQVLLPFLKPCLHL